MNVIPQVMNNLEAMISCFAQKRTWARFTRQVIANIINCGRQTISAGIAAVGREQRDWTQDYQLFSNAKWEPDLCFNVILKKAIQLGGGKVITFVIDETSVRKTGIRIPNTKYIRDPSGPPFQHSIMWGQSFLHTALRIPDSGGPARTLPVRFDLLPKVVKPRRGANPEDWEGYERAKKDNRMTVRACEAIGEMRCTCDALGYEDISLRFVGDGGFANSTMFEGVPDRVDLLVRCRKDLRLCFASKDSCRFYSEEKFSPEETKSWGRWRKGQFFWGGRNRDLSYMEVQDVYWQTGAKRRCLRLIVIRGQRHRGGKEYRDAAYLLTTDLTTDLRELVQAYLDRWEIEVNHRDVKNNMGLGEGQVWSSSSVHRHPQLVALSYSILLLSDLELHGHERSASYLPPPKWYRRRYRASVADLRRHIRHTLHRFPEIWVRLEIQTSTKQLALRCAA